MNKPTPSIFPKVEAKDANIGAKGNMSTVKKVAAGNSKPEGDPTKVDGGWATDYMKTPKHE